MRRPLALAGLLATVAAIGIVDYATGPDVGFSLFYLVPIAIAGWRLGDPHAPIVATASAITWILADIAAAQEVTITVSIWNGFTRLVIFNAIAVLLDRLRRERDHHIEMNRLREQLLYSVAHELRAPLAVLENALDILAEGYADLPADEFAHLTGSAQRTAARLRTLMEDLLSAGSIQAGRFHVDPQPVELREIVAEAVDTVGPVVGERGQTVDVDVTTSLVVNADRRYTRQVLTNLLGNASRYGPAGSAIHVRARADDGHVRVAIDDSGPGIPKEEQPLLFDRFYRPRAAGPGIGLGLAIAKGIVEAHGGRIGIDSGPGRGTSVWFTLPLFRPGARPRLTPRSARPGDV
jgi:signal transduction histidine kinase